MRQLPRTSPGVFGSCSQEIGFEPEKVRLLTESRKIDQAYRYVRNRILDPSLARRSFSDETELASYFDIGSDSQAVIKRLSEEGFLTFAGGGRIELCRFDPTALFRATVVRANLEALSFHLALPRLSEADLNRIQAAGLEFSKGPSLFENLDQVFIIASILHQAAQRPVISLMTQELQRIITPFTYFDLHRTAFDNLAPIFLNLSNLLAHGKVEKVSRTISETYRENSRILANELTEFKRLHKK